MQSKSKWVAITTATMIVLSSNLVMACGSDNSKAANSTQETQMASKQKSADIVDTAIAAGSFNTLVAAVKAAGLVETLKGDGPFTVFAPTDEAFAKLPKGTVEELLKPENKETLQAILTYHVVPGNVTAKDVVKLNKAKTVQGSNVSIITNNAGVMIDGAKVLKTDIATTNGVIHVIDRVIMPKMQESGE